MTMKAVVQHGYGKPERVLSLEEIDRPPVLDDQVLVRVRAASVHPDVWHMVTGRPYLLRLMGAGLRRPKIVVPGTDMAGEVERVGRGVTQLKPGDEVLGECVHGHQWHNGGAYAEYVAVPAHVLTRKPPSLTFEQAAALPTSGLIALQNLRTFGGLAPGQRVLINGAAGCVGSTAVQLAKAFDAHVTGVDHVSKLELVQRIGADRVIDYMKEDFTRGSERYDLILDIPGNHSFTECRRALSPSGIYVLVGHDHFGAFGRRWFGGVPRAFGLMALSTLVRQLPSWRVAMAGSPRLSELSDLLAAGKLTPVIDKAFALREAATAIRYLASGAARGRIVLTV
jgi:NADPH:quinone reductase-like Zn-dependent oxidoreductase